MYVDLFFLLMKLEFPPLELKSSSLGTEKFLPDFLVSDYLAEK